jgi:hypothetical protein
MSNIKITDLDFDAIKANLKDFLRAQSTFSDYDFEGSGLAVLLDVLAYNTHYNAYMANMLANEMFLDSAVKRESAASIAKHIQYTPRSTIGASAKVNVTFASQPGNPSSMTMDRYSPFTTTINGVSYTFVNTEPLSAQRTDGQYYFGEIDIKEGIAVTNVYTVVDPGPMEKYALLNDKADITTLRVFVQKSSTDSTTTTYERAIDLSGIVNATQYTGDDLIFFVEENSMGKYEVFFGDGNIGQRLEAGNIVYIQYVVSNGSKVNVSTTLGTSQIFTGPTVNNINPSVTTVQSSNGGQEKETIEEIKFNAPRANAAQNRLVTEDDYIALIRRELTNVKAISVWGGEKNVPPQYGKVFISILPTSGNALTPQIKEQIIEEVLDTKRIVAIQPSIVDPTFFYVNLSVLVKYDAKRTTLTSTQIKDLVQTKITNYFDVNLDTFNEPFIYSKLVHEIDTADQSIVGNQTGLSVQYRFVPNLTIANSNRIVFNNTLREGSLESTRFIYENNGSLIPVRIKDIPDEQTVSMGGSYKRSGTTITAKFTSKHGLTVDEEVYLQFSGAASDGIYKIYKVLSDYSFTIISSQAGSTSGTIQITSNPRGSLVLYNANTLEIVLNNVGFISYLEGLIQFKALYVKGFPSGIRDIKLTIELESGVYDINVYREQILRLDTSASNTATNQLAGLTITIDSV